MKSPRSFSSTATSTVPHTYRSASDPDDKVTEAPIQSKKPPETTPTTVRLPQPRESASAVKIQSAYRSHKVRHLVRKISAVDSEANYWQRLIQRQETVDAVRTNEREKVKISEALMGLLFRLDSVPGLDPNVREQRRQVSRKIVGLQEILDAVSDTRVEHWDGFLRDWDDIVTGLEKEACQEKRRWEGNGEVLRRPFGFPVSTEVPS